MVVGGPAQEFLRLRARPASSTGMRAAWRGRRRPPASCRASPPSRRRSRARRPAPPAMRRLDRRPSPAAVWRSISRCISDSASPSPTASSLPALSRLTATTGWPSTCTPMPCSASAMVTESTRNGMSSLTICSTVCGDSQPCCLQVRVEQAHLGRAGACAAREIEEVGGQRGPAFGAVLRAFVVGHALVERTGEGSACACCALRARLRRWRPGSVRAIERRGRGRQRGRLRGRLAGGGQRAAVLRWVLMERGSDAWDLRVQGQGWSRHGLHEPAVAQPVNGRHDAAATIGLRGDRGRGCQERRLSPTLEGRTCACQRRPVSWRAMTRRWISLVPS